MRLSSWLYKTARMANNIESIAEPKRAPRRAKNIIVGRALAKVGFWRWLWGGK
jgi:uncharacterized membrane protein YbaN (DUF454 family)